MVEWGRTIPSKKSNKYFLIYVTFENLKLEFKLHEIHHLSFSSLWVYRNIPNQRIHFRRNKYHAFGNGNIVGSGNFVQNTFGHYYCRQWSNGSGWQPND